jgi:UBX domain-containing protein 1
MIGGLFPGEPRSLEDPANKAFLESVSRGECPKELEPPSRDTPVNVNLLRRDEEYVAPVKPRYVAFKGHGRTLAGKVLP